MFLQSLVQVVSARQFFLTIAAIHAGRDNAGVNSLPILWVEVVPFLIFNEGPFKREGDGAMRLATV